MPHSPAHPSEGRSTRPGPSGRLDSSDDASPEARLFDRLILGLSLGLGVGLALLMAAGGLRPWLWLLPEALLLGVLGLLWHHRRGLRRLRRRERTLRELYRITAEPEADATHRVRRLLELGCECLRLDRGSVVRIDGPTHRLQADVQLGVSEPTEPGASPLSPTLCQRTIERSGPLALPEAYEPPEPSASSEPSSAGHCHSAQPAVRAYLGVRLVVGERVYGVLGFSAPIPRQRGFERSDLDFIELIAQAIAGALERAEMVDQIQQAKQRAERASAEKSVLLAHTSHELRTPLNGVNGTLELLEDTPMDDRQRRYVKIARQSANHLLKLIDNVLDFSRVQAGCLELERVQFNPGLLVEDLSAMLAPSAARKGVDVCCHTSGDLPAWVVGDPGRLRQVLMNLLGNAVKFTPSGEIVVRAWLRRTVESATPQLTSSDGEPPQPRPPQRIELGFSVSDTGVGIPPDRMDRLFKSFSQADASTNRRFGGTGLGLAISAQLVELMGGRIEAHSQPGQGTRFVFHVSVGLDTPTTGIEPPANLKGRRVLVLESNATHRQILGDYLRGEDVAVQLVAEPQEALQRLEKAAALGRPFEAALLEDGSDPELAPALCRQIRQDHRFDAVKLLLLSRAGRLRRSEALRQMGVQTADTKPIGRFGLRCLLMRAWQRQTPAEKLGQAGAAVSADASSANAASVDDLSASTPETATDLDGSVDSSARPWLTHWRSVSAGAPVLIVDDHPVNLEIIQRQLQSLGLCVEPAADGLAALERLYQGPIGLVLMDCRMPGMDGLETVRRLRQEESRNKPLWAQRDATVPTPPGIGPAHPSGSRLPVVGLTAEADPQEHRRAIQAGMDLMLTKPVSLTNLEQILRQAWEGIEGSAEASSAGDASYRSDRPEVLQEFASGDPLGVYDQPPEQQVGPEAFDQRMALEMCDGSEQVLQTVLDVFDRNVAQQHEALRLAAQTGRLADVAAEAHKLAGAAAGIGATEMLQWARTLGTLCKGGLGESVVEHVKGFPALLERFQVARDHSGAAAESADASRSGQTDGAAMPESALDGSGVGPDER